MGRATGKNNKNLGALELLKGLYETIGGAGKGVASATLGFPGDIEGLLRMLTPGVSNDPYLPNTERVAKFLPGPDNTMTELGRNLPLTPTQAMKLGAPIARQAAAQVHRGMMGEGPLNGALSAVAPLNVIKDRGGNWLTKELDRAIKPELRAANLEQLMNDFTVDPFLRPEAMEKARTMDRWVNGALKKYIMRDMATEGDPIRKLAEQNILHVDPQELNFNMSTYGKYMMPNQRLRAQSDTAKNWEGATDRSINQLQVKNTVPADVQENPWLAKLGPEEEVYAPFEPKNFMEDLGLDRLHQHVYDALIEGRIRPEQLNSGSFGVEAAVRDAHNVRMAKAATEEKAALEALKGEAVHTHKEYPEGYKWVEFKAPSRKVEGETAEYNPGVENRLYEQAFDETARAHPRLDDESDEFHDLLNDRLNVLKEAWPNLAKQQMGRAQLQKALTAEGDYMGHCVGEYCDDVISGNKRIFALRDPEGRPHVTVEAHVGKAPHYDNMKVVESLPEELLNELIKDHGHGGIGWYDKVGKDPRAKAWAQENLYNQPILDSINQIKGSGKKDSTQAITPEVLGSVQPYIRDFLNSSPWGTVRDMKNTGLRDMSEYSGHKGPRFMTPPEHDELLKANPRLKSPLSEALDDPNFNDGWIPDEHIEFAEGGLVPPPHFEDLDRFLGR